MVKAVYILLVHAVTLCCCVCAVALHAATVHAIIQLVAQAVRVFPLGVQAAMLHSIVHAVIHVMVLARMIHAVMYLLQWYMLQWYLL